MEKTKEQLAAETAAAEEEAKAKAEVEAKEKADAEAEEASEAEAKAKAEADAKANIDIDYKAIAKSEREAREKAEKAAADNAFKLREEKRKREEAEADDYDDLDDLGEDEKPLTRKELDVILDKDRKEQTLSKAKEIASDISGSGDEAEAVMEVYKSRTFPAHLTIDQKLKEAYLIANASKIIGQNTELKRALKGKGLSSKDGSGTHQDPPQKSEPSISNMDKAVLQQVGFNWVGANKRYEKKLNNGKILVREKDKSGNWITRPLSN